MATMRTELALMVALAAAAACNKTNPNYCDEQTPCANGAPCDLVDHSCAGVDAAGPACESSQDCPGNLPYCDVGGSDTCVVCGPEGPSACTGTAPVCDDFSCRPCTADAECAGGVCLPDGACPAPDAIVHAAADGTGTECSAALPCAITQALTNAVALPAGTHPVIQLAAGTYPINATLVVPRDLTMIGPALAAPTASPTAIIRHNGATGAAVRVTGHDATFYRLAAENAGDAASGNGIRCETGGKVTLGSVELRDNNAFQLYGADCDVEVDQSGFVDAQGGGIYVASGSLAASRSRFSQLRDGGINVVGATFSITNNRFFQTGETGMSTFGAIRIDSVPNGTAYTLAFNTLVDNNAGAGIATGISCVTNLQSMLFTSNIVMDSDDGDLDVQSIGGGTCSHDYSYIGNGDVGTGTHNLEVGTPPVLQADHYHLTADSPGLEGGDPAALIDIDVDGDTRPMPEATERDIGADEVE